MRILKQVNYIGCLTSKLSKYVKIIIKISSDSFLQRILENWRTCKYFASYIFYTIFWSKYFSCNITWINHISLPECVYLQDFWVKCISCFMRRCLMTSWNLRFYFRSWIYQEWNELWKQNNFFKIAKQQKYKMKKIFLTKTST